MKSIFKRYLTWCVALTMALVLGCASTRTQESTGQYLDDAAISTKVKTAFLRDDQVSGLQIKVDTYKGIVQLSGFADSQQEKDKASQLARDTEGVREVKNDIVVK